MMPRFSVVVVNYRSAGNVAPALRSVARCGRDEVEIVVVNNSPEEGDALVRPAEEVDAKILGQPGNVGFARAANAGAAATRGRFLVFLNPDAFVEELDLDAVVKAFDRDDRLAAVSAPLVDESGTPQATWFPLPSLVYPLLVRAAIPTPCRGWLRRRLREATVKRPGVQHVAMLTGAALIVRRAAWEAIGPFDERYFMYFEDADWQHRAGLAGWRSGLLPDGRVVHTLGGSRGVDLEWYPHWYVSGFAYLRKWGIRGLPLLKICLLVALSFRAVVLRVTTHGARRSAKTYPRVAAMKAILHG